MRECCMPRIDSRANQVDDGFLPVTLQVPHNGATCATLHVQLVKRPGLHGNYYFDESVVLLYPYCCLLPCLCLACTVYFVKMGHPESRRMTSLEPRDRAAGDALGLPGTAPHRLHPPAGEPIAWLGPGVACTIGWLSRLRALRSMERRQSGLAVDFSIRLQIPPESDAEAPHNSFPLRTTPGCYGVSPVAAITGTVFLSRTLAVAAITRSTPGTRRAKPASFPPCSAKPSPAP